MSLFLRAERAGINHSSQTNWNYLSLFFGQNGKLNPRILRGIRAEVDLTSTLYVELCPRGN